MKESTFHFFPNQYFIDLCLYQYGYEQRSPLASFGPYIRNHYLFHYVISGSGTLIAEDGNGNDHTFHVRAGQGFLIFPGQKTTYYADQENPWEYTWFEFDGVRVEEILVHCSFSRNHPIYTPADRTLAAQLRDSMLELVYHDKDCSPFALIGRLYQCIDYLVRSAMGRRPVLGERMTDSYIKEAIHFIEQNYAQEISVEDIAAFCSLSRGYLSKIMKKYTGQSPQELLMNYRMTKAAQLLKLTSLSVKEVGKMVGYPNQLHFSRAFKTIYGQSPALWRKQAGPAADSHSTDETITQPPEF